MPQSQKGEMLSVGSRLQVWRGKAKKTSGGLTKSDLTLNKAGRIVSKKASEAAKNNPRLKEQQAKAKQAFAIALENMKQGMSRKDAFRSAWNDI